MNLYLRLLKTVLIYRGVRSNMVPFFKWIALVAQGIEHRIPNPGVARSIRAGGTKLIRIYKFLCFRRKFLHRNSFDPFSLCIVSFVLVLIT